MSDYIRPVPDPGREPESREKKKVSRKILRRVLIFAGILLLVSALVLLILATQTTLLDPMVRGLRYMGRRDTAFSLETGGVLDAAPLGSRVAAANTGGVTVYTDRGEPAGSLQRNLRTPILLPGENSLLLFDAGGTASVLLDRDCRVLLELTPGGQIIDADLSRTDAVALLTTGEDSNGTLNVYASDGTLVFRRLAKNHFLNACALSPDGEWVAASQLGQEDVSFACTVQLFRTDSRDPIAETPTRCGLIFDLFFLDSHTLCAVGTYGLTFLSTEGEILSDYAFSDRALLAYAPGEGCIALALDTYDVTARHRLVLLDRTGRELSSVSLPQAPEELSVSSAYVAVLMNGEAAVYDLRLESRGSVSTDGACHAVCVRRDGSALLLSDSRARLFVP